MLPLIPNWLVRQVQKIEIDQDTLKNEFSQGETAFIPLSLSLSTVCMCAIFLVLFLVAV